MKLGKIKISETTTNKWSEKLSNMDGDMSKEGKKE